MDFGAGGYSKAGQERVERLKRILIVIPLQFLGLYFKGSSRYTTCSV